MNKSLPYSVSTLAALLFAGAALAQTPSVENDRVARRCTTSTLSTDPTAPCPDDVLNDRPAPRATPSGYGPGVGNPNAGTIMQPGSGTILQPSPGTIMQPSTGTILPGTTSNTGPASTSNTGPASTSSTGPASTSNTGPAATTTTGGAARTTAPIRSSR